MTVAESYARDLLAPGNEWKSGRYMKLAAQRFLSDLQRTDIYFDEVEANRMINFGERYCLLAEDSWKGQPMKFEPWQKFIFQQTFGWYYKESGRRRIREVYVQIAKKNGKSCLAGILALWHLFADTSTPTPRVFITANNEDQAKITASLAGDILRQSPDLSAKIKDGECEVYEYLKKVREITFREKDVSGRDGFIKPLSKETDDKKSKQAGGKHGINASMGIVDEYGMSPDQGGTKTISSSMAARKNPLMFYITTAGFNKDGPCFTQQRKIGVDILENYGTPAAPKGADYRLSFIYEMDEADDWKDPKNWLKCNPNLGVSVDSIFLETRIAEAETEGGSTEVDVKTLNFDMWCDAPAVFIPQDTWRENTHGIAESELAGKWCFGGLEIPHGPIGSLALIFPNIRENVHALKVFFWMPENKVIKNDLKVDFSQYRDFMTICSGDVIENSLIYETISRALAGYNVHSIAFPKPLETHDILQSLVRDGYQCNPISQGYSGISTPTVEWEKLLTAKQIEHFGNPLLSWMNSQCEGIRKDGMIKLAKSGGKTAGIHAAVNAVGQWLTIDAEPDEESGITELSFEL